MAMDEGEARHIIATHKEQKPSKIGEAVDFFHQQHRSYKVISHMFEEVKGVSADLLSSRHRIFQLPEGIRWQIDEGRITTPQGDQVAKLPDADDQWLLAFAIADAELTLTGKECGHIVKAVVKEKLPIKEALRHFTGLPCDSITSVMMPFGFDERFAISKVAWNKNEELENFCLHLIRVGKDIDREAVANQLEEIASGLRAAGR